MLVTEVHQPNGREERGRLSERGIAGRCSPGTRGFVDDLLSVFQALKAAAKAHPASWATGGSCPAGEFTR